MTESEPGAQRELLEPPHPGMAAEHALLGLLAVAEGGVSHGYELARHFGSDSALGSVIRQEPGMVYHHLKKLERLGWIVGLIDESVRPARRMVVLQPEGRSELERWLAEPVAHTREIRLDFLVKLYFALTLNPALALRLAAEQRAISAKLVESWVERSDETGEGSVALDDVRFSAMVVDLRRAQTHAALSWLDRVGEAAEKTLARRSEPPPVAMPAHDPGT